MHLKKDPLLATLFFLIWGITFLHMYAEFHSWYWRFRDFDIPMHFLGGMWLGFFALRFGKQFPLLRLFSGIGLVFVGGIGIGFLWELYEWSVWMLLGTGLPVGYVADTLLDLCMDVVGAVSAYGIYHIFFQKKESANAKEKGFTMIELMIAVAIIGILGTVVLATVDFRPRAKEAAVFAELESVQRSLSQCVFRGKVLYTGGGDAGGGEAAVPVAGGEVCGKEGATSVPDTSFGVWPKIDTRGWAYGGKAGSEYSEGKFVYFAYRTDAVGGNHRVICCTQKKCSVSERTVANMSFVAGRAQTNFCRTEAGIATED